jgi:hypothetical protein
VSPNIHSPSFTSIADRRSPFTSPPYIFRSRHSLLLRGSLLSTDPLWPVGNEQLGVGLEVIEEAVIV